MRREVEKLDPRVPVTTVRMKEDHLTVAVVGPRVATAIAYRGSGNRASRLPAANLATPSDKIPGVPAVPARGRSQ